jgi:hypothetical protein
MARGLVIHKCLTGPRTCIAIVRKQVYLYLMIYIVRERRGKERGKRGRGGRRERREREERCQDLA